MTHDEAVAHLRNALYCVQKTRSIHSEAYSDVPTRVRVFFEPKTQDERWLLKPLLKLVEQVDNGGQVKPMDFYNIMTVIDKFAPELPVEAAALEIADFPKPDVAWIREGWSNE